MRREVFISYSTKDREKAESVCEALEAQGIPCWMAPRDIKPGAIWTEAIIEALNECRVLVLILSSNANASRQVQREVFHADNVNISIVTLRIEDVSPANVLNFFLGMHHWLDAITQPFEEHLQALAEALRKYIPPLEPYELPGLDPVTWTGISGVFDRAGQLDTQLFSFNVNEVLLRGALRRNRQQRARLSLSDFLFGLLWKGDLTRYLLRRRRLDSDALANEFLKRTETEGTTGGNGHGTPTEEQAEEAQNFDPETADDEQMRAYIAKLIVRHRDEMTEHLVRRLEDAWQRARSLQGADARISEQDVLASFIAAPDWLQQTALGLPNAIEMRHLLRERERDGEVDENGVLIFQGLDKHAEHIIANAHMLAQQHGLFPIPNRMLFAAFLNAASGYAADLFRRLGHDPEEILSFLLASAEEESTSFALSMEACARIILPVVEEAKRLAGPGQTVTEQMLFKAFCRIADPAFKAWLKGSPEQVDLDDLTPTHTITPPVAETELETVRQQIKEFVAQAAAPYGIGVDVSPEVAPWLLKKARSEGGDVRHIGIMIEQHIRVPLMIALANLKGQKSTRLLLAVRPDKLRVECRRREGGGPTDGA